MLVLHFLKWRKLIQRKTLSIQRKTLPTFWHIFVFTKFKKQAFCYFFAFKILKKKCVLGTFQWIASDTNSATYEYDFEMGVGALLTWSLTLFKTGMGMCKKRKFQREKHNFQYALRSIWNSNFGKLLDFWMFFRIFR